LAAYSQNFENLNREGAPVDWVPLDPVYGNLNPMGLSARAPHPSAGKLFIDFVLSKAGQETIRAQRRVPDRVDVLPDRLNWLRAFPLYSLLMRCTPISIAM
jgi:iron(III) transport system substrate-binding protein